MIQRLQTLWLLFAAICMAFMFKLSFYSGQISEVNKENVKILGNNTIQLGILISIFTTLALVLIFLYKNRKLQMRLAALNLIIALYILYCLYAQTKTVTNGTYSLTAVLPIFAIGFTISAIHCIWQDERKIKELNSNRIR